MKLTPLKSLNRQPRFLILGISYVAISIALFIAGVYSQALFEPAFNLMGLPQTGDATSVLAQSADTNLEAINKKVLVISFDPLMFNSGKGLSQYRSWNSVNTLANEYINYFKTLTGNRVNYTLQGTETIKSFPELIGGSKYDATRYLNCLNNSSKCYKDAAGQLLAMNYVKFFNNSNYCQRFNKGDFDEIWMFGGPNFGIAESLLVGANSFKLASSPINGICSKPMPVMGFNYQKDLSAMVEGFMHRNEATMQQVYKGRSTTALTTNWDKFTYTAKESNTAFSGCGWSNFTPVSTTAKVWNQTGTGSSFCDEFYNYPEINTTTLKAVTCNDWGCSAIGYFSWQLKHLPNKVGIGPDGKLNDWWQYVLSPEKTYTTPIVTAIPTVIASPTATPIVTVTNAVTKTVTPSITNMPTISVVPAKQATGTVRIPVILYHHVGPKPGYIFERRVNVTEPIFRQEMAYLKTKGYKTLTLDQYIDQVKTGKNPSQKSVLLTIDDGYLDAYTTVFPILKEYGFVATFFIVPTKSEMSTAQIKELSDAGMDIQSHTTTHYSLNLNTNPQIWDYQLNTSKTQLEAITGKPIKAMAYPRCVYNNAVVKYLAASTSYQLSFQCQDMEGGTSIDAKWTNRFILNRTWAYDNLNNFVRHLNGYQDKFIDKLPDDKNGFHFAVI